MRARFWRLLLLALPALLGILLGPPEIAPHARRWALPPGSARVVGSPAAVIGGLSAQTALPSATPWSFREPGSELPVGHAFPTDPRTPARVHRYADDMKDVLARLKRALEASDASFRDEFGCLSLDDCPHPGRVMFAPGSPGFPKLFQDYRANGGRLGASEFAAWYTRPGNALLMAPSGAFGLWNHHAWIASHQRLLDLFAQKKIGIVFMGPELGLTRLKELDDAQRSVINIWINDSAARLASQRSAGAHEAPSKPVRLTLSANYPDYHPGKEGSLQVPVLWQPLGLPSTGNVFLYAVCVDGLQVLDEVYLGVPTLVEIQYDPPLDKPEVPLDLRTPAGRLTLVARRYDKRGYIFRTELFTVSNPGAAVRSSPATLGKGAP